ncbi:MAG: hypothetical protein GF347_03645 [Candidatus Moranbacteria bacterium]|nr:hypothetical protein [Candidatus Moranbacteria bacterium]
MKILKGIFNLLYPIKCIKCGKPGNYLCPGCNQTLIRHKNNRCAFCGELSRNGQSCPDCLLKTSINQVLICFEYDQETLKSLIYLLKYKSVRLIARDLAHIYFKELVKLIKLDNPKKTLITCTPMHQKKELIRGYNQASQIAGCLSQLLNLPFLPDLLVKIKPTKAQMALQNHSARKLNLKNSIKLNDKYTEKNLLKNKTVLIVDDIMTTGATFLECSKILSGSELNQIIALAFARQFLSSKTKT